MTETIDTANLRALAENIIAADGPIWWIEQDFRAVKEVLEATIDDARFVAAANPSTILALLDRLAAAEARNATLTDEAVRKTEQLDKLLAHCPEGECYTCSAIICPHACELHFHHDGCPACAEHDAAASISTKGDGRG